MGANNTESKIIRQCVSCREKKDRNDLIKITIDKNKTVKIMPDNKFFGRSVYLCKNSKCIDNIFKKGRIFKILKIKPDDTLELELRAVID